MFLKCSNIVLRAVDPVKDSYNVMNWFADERVTQYMVYGQRPQTQSDIQSWLAADVAATQNDVFIIEDLNNKPIGIAGLYNISLTSRSAELRILIGNDDCRGKGGGKQVVKKLLLYGFNRLNMNSIWLGVTDENVGAIRCYEKCGFKKQGRRRQSLYRNGQYYDSIWMDILRSEYEVNNV